MSQERPNSLTGAEAMVHMLKAYGVKHIFGLCGDTSLPFYDALFRMDHGIDHILTRDERCAAYMADGYARVTNRIGVCEGPSGGGATYIAPGLVEANESSVPILAINSDVSTTSTGRYPLTELDQKALFRPLTKWNGVLDNAATLPRMVRTAFRAMTTGRPGAAHLAFPIDVQRAETPPDELWADPAHQSYPAWASAPDPANVAVAIELLLKSSSPMIICGGGPVISGAMDELQRFVERLDLPVATSVSGKGVIAETHPNCLGVVGSNGGCDAATAAVAAADLVIFIGCRAGSVTTERWSIPKAGAKIIHIDSDPMVIGASFDTDVALVGDARLALAAFNMLLDGLGDRDMPGGFNGGAVAAKVQTARQTRFRGLATSDATPILPERVVDSLNRLLPDNSVVVADPGTPCPYMSAYLTMKKPGRRCRLPWVRISAVPMQKPFPSWAMAVLPLPPVNLKPLSGATCRSPSLCSPTAFSAGSRPVRNPVSANASFQSTSTVPTMPPWHRPMASSHGVWNSRGNWMLPWPPRWPMTDRHWSMSSASRYRMPQHRSANGLPDQKKYGESASVSGDRPDMLIVT